MPNNPIFPKEIYLQGNLRLFETRTTKDARFHNNFKEKDPGPTQRPNNSIPLLFWIQERIEQGDLEIPCNCPEPEPCDCDTTCSKTIQEKYVTVPANFTNRNGYVRYFESGLIPNNFLFETQDASDIIITLSIEYTSLNGTITNNLVSSTIASGSTFTEIRDEVVQNLLPSLIGGLPTNGIVYGNASTSMPGFFVQGWNNDNFKFRFQLSSTNFPTGSWTNNINNDQGGNYVFSDSGSDFSSVYFGEGYYHSKFDLLLTKSDTTTERLNFWEFTEGQLDLAEDIIKVERVIGREPFTWQVGEILNELDIIEIDETIEVPICDLIKELQDKECECETDCEIIIPDTIRYSFNVPLPEEYFIEVTFNNDPLEVPIPEVTYAGFQIRVFTSLDQVETITPISIFSSSLVHPFTITIDDILNAIDGSSLAGIVSVELTSNGFKLIPLIALERFGVDLIYISGSSDNRCNGVEITSNYPDTMLSDCRVDSIYAIYENLTQKTYEVFLNGVWVDVTSDIEDNYWELISDSDIITSWRTKDINGDVLITEDINTEIVREGINVNQSVCEHIFDLYTEIKEIPTECTIEQETCVWRVEGIELRPFACISFDEGFEDYDNNLIQITDNAGNSVELQLNYEQLSLEAFLDDLETDPIIFGTAATFVRNTSGFCFYMDDTSSPPFIFWVSNVELGGIERALGDGWNVVTNFDTTDFSGALTDYIWGFSSGRTIFFQIFRNGEWTTVTPTDGVYESAEEFTAWRIIDNEENVIEEGEPDFVCTSEIVKKTVCEWIANHEERIKELEENQSGTQVQSDWDEADTDSPAYIQNKPTIPTVPTVVSAFTNDAGYQTAAQLSTAILPLLPLASYLGAAGHTGDQLETIVLTFTIQPNQWLPKAMYQVIADCNRITQSSTHRIYLNTAPVIAGGILIFHASGAASVNTYRHFMVDGNTISHTDGVGTSATDINSSTNATRVLSTLDRSVPIFVICTIQGSVNAANGEFLNIQIGLV